MTGAAIRDAFPVGARPFSEAGGARKKISSGTSERIWPEAAGTTTVGNSMLAVGIRLRNGGEEDSGAAALPLKPEQLRIPIRPLQEPIDQQIRRDPAERDPVPPVAKREIAMGKLPHAADVGQAVPALPEGAAPSPIDVARNGGEQLGATVFEPGSLTGEKA